MVTEEMSLATDKKYFTEVKPTLNYRTGNVGGD